MNFDEIKLAMEQEKNDLQVPFSLSEIKTSQTSIKKVKKWIIIDIVSVIIFILVLVYLMFYGEMYPAAKVIFNYTAFIAIMANIGTLMFQIKIHTSLSIQVINSRKTIEKYIILIKTYIEFSKIVITGLVAAMLIPLMIASIGTGQHSENYVNDLVNLNISTVQINRKVAYILVISLVGYFYSGWYYKRTIERESKALEKILDQF